MGRKSVIAIVSVCVLGAALWLAKAYYFPAPAPAEMLGAKTYSVAESSLGDLLANEQARELLDEFAPGLADIRQLDVARPLYLEDLQSFYPDLIDTSTFAKLDEALREIKGSGIEVYNSASTLVGILLDDPESREILDRNLTGFSSHPQIDQGRGFTLSFMAKFQPETMTDEVLATIDAEFKALAEQRAASQ